MDQTDFDFRYGLSSQIGEAFREKLAAAQIDAGTCLPAYDAAIRLMRSQSNQVFDLTRETDATRKSYGEHRFGQGCLLARRLVESGVGFVEVTLQGWDTHVKNFERIPELCRQLDQAMSALLDDLQARGLLAETLVVLATEFGRTPVINQNDGRDHFPGAFSFVFAGGGIAGGQRYGQTDRTGEAVIENGVSPADMNATIAHALGLPLAKVIQSSTGRPFTVANKGKPVVQLFG